MPTEDDIALQKQLLSVHRATLAHYLLQRAQLGAYAPPGVTSGIAEARVGIAYCKATLRGWGMHVDDHPDDEARPAAQSIDLAPAPHTTIQLKGLQFSEVPKIDKYQQIYVTHQKAPIEHKPLDRRAEIIDTALLNMVEQEQLIQLYKRRLQLLTTIQGSIDAADQAPQEQRTAVALHQMLVAYFNDSELREICFTLQIDYESLAGQGKADKARELIEYVRRRGHINQLEMLVHQRRPHVSWEQMNPVGSLDILMEPAYIQARIDSWQRALDLVKASKIEEALPLENDIQNERSPSTTENVGSTAPHLPSVELRPDLEIIRLTTPEQALLQQLFSDCRHLLIEQEFGAGYSACRVFLVAPWGETKLAPLVVKIGPADLILDEKRRHERYVAHTLHGLAADIRRAAEHDDLAAIAYTFLGGAIFGAKTCSLGDYYRRSAPSEVREMLRHLLVEALGSCWYRQRRIEQRSLFYEEFYGPYFPADLTIAVDTVSAAPLAPDAAYERCQADTLNWREYRAIEPGMAIQLEEFQVEQHKPNRLSLSLPNRPFQVRANLPPQARLPSLQPGQPVWLRGRVTSRRQDDLAAIVAAIFADSPTATIDPAAGMVMIAGQSYINPLTVYQEYLAGELLQNLSTIHGDLHLFNVIVDEFRRPWLLDFGRVGVGHVLFDFVELETHLRHAVLGEKEIPLADLVDFERRLISAPIGSAERTAPAHPELARAFEVILSIREFAARYRAIDDRAADDGFEREYFPALLLYALSTLKHHQDNGQCSARHAFVVAALLASSLRGTLAYQEDAPSALTVTDPAIELHVYYLASAAGDSREQQAARRNTFTAQLQQATDALRGWLRLPSVSIVWQPDPPAGPSTMARLYYSDLWQDSTGSRHIWLSAYEMNDTYLLRCVIEQRGQYPPGTFDDLRRSLPWQPDQGTPEWFGQRLVYYTSPYTGSPIALARAVFGTPTVLHTTLACGELYCRPDLESAYLLVGVRPEQEALAGDFLDRLAPQLGWYICKAIGQEQQYLTYLAPTVNTAEHLLSSVLARARQLHKLIPPGQSDPDIRSALSEQIHMIAAVLLEYQTLLTMVKQILETITINVDNYHRVSAPGALLADAAQDEIFVAQRRELDVLPARINAALRYWEATLELAQDHLKTLRSTG
jgi:hypothetical protein